MSRFWTLSLTGLLAMFLVPAMFLPAFGQCVIEVPATGLPIHLAAVLPPSIKAAENAWQLVDTKDPNVRFPAQLTVSWKKDGTPDPSRLRVLATVTPQRDTKASRSFQLRQVTASHTDNADTFQFVDEKGTTLRLQEGDRNVLSYNYGTITNPRVPRKDTRRSRGTYIHPVWGLQGEMISADFPKDHYHHHGIFWAWPYVKVADHTYDLWMYSDIQQRFVKWLHRETGPVAAVLGVENGWFVGERKVATERVWLTVYHTDKNARSFRLSVTVVAGDKPVTLQGRQKKSYGGLTFRYDVWPRKDAIVRVPERTLRKTGSGLASNEDLVNTPLPWADLASKFPGSRNRSGAAVFVSPQHPDYPPSWLTRTYGALCVGWPGVKPYTIAANKSITLDYGFWVHPTELDSERIGQAYATYAKSLEAKCQ